METYRVIFNNNRPVYARPMGKEENSGIRVICENGKKQIAWLAVDGYDEMDSMSVANEMLQVLKRFL